MIEYSIIHKYSPTASQQPKTSIKGRMDLCSHYLIYFFFFQILALSEYHCWTKDSLDQASFSNLMSPSFGLLVWLVVSFCCFQLAEVVLSAALIHLLKVLKSCVFRDGILPGVVVTAAFYFLQPICQFSDINKAFSPTQLPVTGNVLFYWSLFTNQREIVITTFWNTRTRYIAPTTMPYSSYYFQSDL